MNNHVDNIAYANESKKTLFDSPLVSASLAGTAMAGILYSDQLLSKRLF
ncbi:MAG: hypothetical protein AAF621_02490 [Pseudomonadota bacterium]